MYVCVPLLCEHGERARGVCCMRGHREASSACLPPLLGGQAHLPLKQQVHFETTCGRRQRRAGTCPTPQPALFYSVVRGDATQAGSVRGYSRSGRGLFGTDVFLACVYAVYMFTVFRVKLSQEFNRILPELPELVQRVLGVRALAA